MKTSLKRKLLIALMLSCLSLASCVSFDEYPSTGYDPDPPPEAIVGMWTSSFYIEGTKYTTSLLFNSDGTGLWRDFDTNKPFSWKYDGAGLWTSVHAIGTQTLGWRVAPIPDAGGSRAIYMVSNSATPGRCSEKYVRVE